MLGLLALACLSALAAVARADKVLRVQVVARHGARTPLSLFPGDRAEFACELAEAPAVGYLEGGGAPTARFQTVYSEGNLLKGNCPTGFLTAQGFEQHRREGKRLAERYKAAGILPENLTAETLGALYLRSTQPLRTRLSLVAEVVGMYPELESRPGNAVFPVVHLGEEGLDPLSSVKCAAAEEGRGAILELPENKDYLDSLEGELERLNRLAGVAEGEEQLGWSQICDNLIARDYMGMPLPPGFSPEDLDLACGVMDWIYEARYCSGEEAGSTRLNRLLAGPLLRELYEGMFGEPLLPGGGESDERGENEEGHRGTAGPLRWRAQRLPPGPEAAAGAAFQFYSSHDNVLAPVLGALVGNRWACEKPPFASTLRIELVEGQGGQRLLFWYKDEPLVPEWCGEDGACTKEAYKAYLLENYAWESKAAWAEACSAPW